MASWRARGALVFLAAVVPGSVFPLVGSGCGDGGPIVEEDAGTDADPSGGGKVTVLTPEADPLPGQSKCEVTITTEIPVESAKHVEVCSGVGYGTNPPSGGDHWGVWAAYTSYDQPVPREMFVHNMEHGAVVLLHDCDGDCAGVLDTLAQAREALSGDAKCLQVPGGPTERVVITPDPELDVPLAAAAWGATYKATCLDLPSLIDFAKKAYDKGPESTCAQGKQPGTPGAPDCDGNDG